MSDSEDWTDFTAFVSRYLLQSGAVYMELEFGKWYVEVEFTMALSQNIVSVRCWARNANSGFEHFCWVWPSLKVTFREAISTVFPSKGLCMRAFRHIEDDFIFHKSKQTYVPDLTCLQTLVTILVTEVFANTRHHRRHWLLCEYSSSPSTYINRRLGFYFKCRQHPLSSQ